MSPRMLIAMLALMFSAVSFTACGESEGNDENHENHENHDDGDEYEARAGDIAALTGDATTGEALWGQHCSSCHGEDGAGTASGPDLLAETDDGDADFAEDILEGEGNMPSYDGVLEDQEIADVIAYLRQLQGA